MQDAYVGDVGDYGKLSLLRHLRKYTSLQVGVLWHYVIPLHKNSDGKHRKYLDANDPHYVARVDPDAYAVFRDAGFRENLGHSVKKLEERFPEFSYVREICHSIKGSPFVRTGWLEKAGQSLHHCDVIFCDPDNGISNASSPSEKHVAVHELIKMFNWGHTLVVYHHLGRNVSHLEQIQSWEQTLSPHFPGAKISSLRFPRGTGRVYFVIANPKHKRMLGPWIQQAKTDLKPLMHNLRDAKRNGAKQLLD